MGEVDEARQMILSVEADISERKYHYQWGTAYAEAGEILKRNGLEQEALEAQWMARLMFLPIASEGERSEHKSFFSRRVSVVGMPNLEDITDETLDYYAGRAEGLQNPIIACRCHEVIWERRKSYEAVCLAIEAHAEGAKVFTSRELWLLAVLHLSRAVYLARQLKKRGMVNRLKGQWRGMIDVLDDFSAPGALSSVIDMEALFGDLVSVEERRQLARRCLEIAEHFAGEPIGGSDRCWLSKARGLFTKTKDVDSARECSYGMSRSHRREGEVYLNAGSHLMAVHCLHEARTILASMGAEYQHEADEIALILEQEHPLAAEQMPWLGVPFHLPREALDGLIEELMEEPLPDALRGIFCSRDRLPRIADLQKQAGHMPVLWSILPRTVLDGRNVTARSDGSGLDEGHVLELIGYEWQARGPIMAWLADGLLSRRSVRLEDFDSLIEERLVSSGPRQLILRGIERYLAGDHTSAMHILIPQFESCIRRLLKQLRKPTSRPKPSRRDLSEERVLDGILREDAVRQVLGEDLWYFYRFVFTDQRGLNLRNVVCHGLADADTLNEVTSVTVLIALLSLVSGTWRSGEDDPTSEE